MAGAETARAVCSAKGCSAQGRWVLAWNNPKVHEPTRRKAWVACDDHRTHLTQFLDSRRFLRAIVALQDWHGEALPGAEP